MTCCPTCGQVVPEPFDTVLRDLPHLPPTEREVFRALYKAGPAGLSRDRLFARVWGTTRNPPNEKVIDVTISHLRKKLAGKFAIYTKYAVRRQNDYGLYRLVQIAEARAGV